MINELLKILCVTLVSRRAQVSAETNYCDITCDGASHTMCQYPNGGGLECINNFKVYLGQVEENYILDQMNKLRSDAAEGKGVPAAANMMELVWDKELATIAKRWADQCGAALHDVCRKTLSGDDPGQTSHSAKFEKTAFAISSKVRIQRLKDIILGAWAAEKRSFNDAWTQAYYSNKGKDYSQMVWADVRTVGCGYSEFQLQDAVLARFVCNYDKRGNIEGAPVYLQGAPCSACPSGANCSTAYPGLCLESKYDLSKGKGVASRLCGSASLAAWTAFLAVTFSAVQ